MTRPQNKFTRIADECGLTIELDCEVSWREIQYFAEQIVDECIRAVERTSTNKVTSIHDTDLVSDTIQDSINNIKEHFGWAK